MFKCFIIVIWYTNVDKIEFKRLFSYSYFILEGPL